MVQIFKYYWLYFSISLLIVVLGGVAFSKSGLQLSIDFTGGSLVELVSVEQEKMIRKDELIPVIEEVADVDSIQETQQQSFIVRTTEMSNQQKDEIIDKLQEKGVAARVIRFETVGPILGKELLVKTVIAVIIVSLVIMLYVMRQFSELRYGIAAIVAMLHDTAILFSVFSILGWWKGVEIDVLFVTAVLTTLSFSVHDTIVVFDRMRELKHTFPREKLKDIANVAVLQTLTRSLNNSLTIIIMLLCLVLLGGESLRWFAVALLVGSITGTYSSTFTAIPLLLLWDVVKGKLLRTKS